MNKQGALKRIMLGEEIGTLIASTTEGHDLFGSNGDKI
jgi:hypothetical protein